MAPSFFSWMARRLYSVSQGILTFPSQEDQAPSSQRTREWFGHNLQIIIMLSLQEMKTVGDITLVFSRWNGAYPTNHTNTNVNKCLVGKRPLGQTPNQGGPARGKRRPNQDTRTGREGTQRESWKSLQTRTDNNKPNTYAKFGTTWAEISLETEVIMKTNKKLKIHGECSKRIVKSLGQSKQIESNIIQEGWRSPTARLLQGSVCTDIIYCYFHVLIFPSTAYKESMF